MPIKDARIWLCNTNPKEIVRFWKHKNPSVAHSIWLAWSKYNFQPQLDTPEEVLDTLLWGNSLIPKAGKANFDKKLVNSNIAKVIDLIDVTTKRLYKYEKLIDHYGPNIDALSYCAICAALPRKWLCMIREDCTFEEPIDIKTTIDKLDNFRPASRKIYWELIDRFYPKGNLPGKFVWQRQLGLQINDDMWSGNYKKILRQVKPYKLRYLHFRIITRTLTTNVLRNKWKPEVSPLCTFCQADNETILHILFDCPKVKKIWTIVEKALNYYCGLRINLTAQMVIMNNYAGKCKELINSAFIILKQVIYSSKCKGDIPSFNVFMSKVSYWYEIDKAYETGNQQKILKKW